MGLQAFSMFINLPNVGTRVENGIVMLCQENEGHWMAQGHQRCRRRQLRAIVEGTVGQRRGSQ